MARRKPADLRATANVRLISPLVLRSAKIAAMEKSILEEEPAWRGRFAAIRASNVINPRFFSTEERERILAYCHGYLKDEAVLLISRNQIEAGSETERGSLWRRTSEGFALLEDFGGGSEIKADVAAFHVTRQNA
jgi:hypothetical protein